MSEDVCICNLDSPSYPPTEEEMEQCPVHRKKVYPKGTMQEWFDDNPLKWCKGVSIMYYTGGKPKSCCLIGALSVVYSLNADYFRVQTKIMKHLDINHIPSWNDAPERTFADIKALVKELNI